VRVSLREGLLFDEGSHLGDLNVVQIPQVVAEIELGKAQRHLEAGLVGGQVFFSEKGDYMVRAVWQGLVS
jgi:hypothetical protein